VTLQTKAKSIAVDRAGVFVRRTRERFRAALPPPVIALYFASRPRFMGNSNLFSGIRIGGDEAARHMVGKGHEDEGDRLVAALRAGGDREAIYGSLYELYLPRIRACFFRRGFSADECDDLVQEAFLRVVRGLDGFRGQAKFSTWVFEIAENLWKKEVGKRLTKKRDAEVIIKDDMDVLPSKDSSPEAKALTAERKRLLEVEVEKLPPQMRRCVKLRLQEMKFSEIAVLMRISINTVKSHLAQAKERLTQSLGSFDETPFRDLERGET
jgi:RNA polymerase sigma-70 factor (ECF subfamily)